MDIIMQILNKMRMVSIMHELSYILDIIDTVNGALENDSIKEVKTIVVDVGKMSGVVPFYLDKYFEEAKKGTIFSNTKLEINEIDVKIQCEKCKTIYIPDKENRYKCPKCGERKGELLQGKGITINNIIVED